MVSSSYADCWEMAEKPCGLIDSLVSLKLSFAAIRSYAWTV